MLSSSYLVALKHAIRQRNKRRFHVVGRTLLARVARELRLSTANRDLRSSFGGPAVMGEAILHADEIYVSISDRDILVRTCSGRKDYSGGRNHLWPLDELADPHAFALKARGLIVAKIAAQG
jgi:hypothetical protein